MTKEFASYEKFIRSTVTTIHHIARIRMNSTATDIKDTLKYVPNNAVFVACDEGDSDNVWELIFEEQV